MRPLTLVLLLPLLGLCGQALAAEPKPVPYANRAAAAIQAATAPEKAKDPAALTAEEVASFQHPANAGVFLNKYSAKADIGAYTGAFKITLDKELEDPKQRGFTILRGDGSKTIQVVSKSGKRGGKTVRVVVARRKIARPILSAVVYPDAAADLQAVAAEATLRLEALIAAGKRYGLFGGLVVYWATQTGEYEQLGRGQKLRTSGSQARASALRFLARFESPDGALEESRAFRFVLAGPLAEVARIVHPRVEREGNTWTVRASDQAEVRLELDFRGNEGLAALWHERLQHGLGGALSDGALRIRVQGDRK